ncbi:terpene cyclase/mutase family protein [Flexivirga sp. ID2601S]|uniref:Terpene cyclase/mutase family protein n=1 Tax=Flexivirga aerilata TaxID=1656889 RepID=A0A849AHZ6_9MICO|nr:prenyltransferase/squalene oxidase repeat-containing protein [Flexivirga aerilata]NNG39477.1 terpene cyclase/mutase family protein [Flexivirga aerilata]
MTTTRRAGAGLATIACAGLTGFALAAPAGAATPDAGTAGSFLTAQLAAGGDHFSTSAGGQSYPDYGLTIDAVLALDAARVGQQGAGRAAAYVSKNAASYNAMGSDLYAAATAKLLVFAQVQGLPSAGYAGQLRSLQQPSGQFKDKSAYGDYSNTIGQSLGVIGLQRAGTPNAAATAFLLKQQCTDGGFRISFAGACTSDPDATTYAVQALAASGGHAAAIGKAAGFLAGKQTANGGIIEPAAGPTPNANTTALAAVAFTLAGNPAAAAKAKAFVAGLQYDCSFPAALRGGIAYDRKAFDAQKAKGKASTAIDSDRRSTSQAVLGLTGTPYLTLTAGGSASAPSLACGAPAPTGTPSATGTATGTATATSTTTGPPIITDGGTTGTGNSAFVVGGAAAVGGVALASAGLRRRLRRR